jgi:sugar phosphate isomerase/epimerase
MVAAPNIGLLVDTWDIVASGGSLDSIIKLPVQQIVAVQVADLSADPATPLDEKTSRLLPGGENGRIDVAGFLATLRQAGYDGPVTAKPSKAAVQSRRRDVVIKQASEALDKVLRVGGDAAPAG